MSYKLFDDFDWVSDEAKEFALYWRSLAEPGMLPRQSQLNPADIPHLLPGIAIYELRSDKEIICRLMGTGLVDQFGSDFTDKNILKWWPYEERGYIEGVLRQMTVKNLGVFARFAGYTAADKKVSGISVGFPALDVEGSARRLLFHTNNVAIPGSRNPRDDKVVNFEVLDVELIDLN